MRDFSRRRRSGRFPWVAVGALLFASGACQTGSSSSRSTLTDGGPVAQVQVRAYLDPTSHKLDLLFMVDDGPTMAPLQGKLRNQLGAFIDALVDPATGKLPDLHIAVISSSFGAGAWSNVPSCSSGSHPGDDRGYFQQGPGGAGMGQCPALHAGATFLSTGDDKTPATYDGDIRDALKCMVLLGDTGCAFRSAFESTYYALYYANMKAGNDVDQNTQNGGFLRSDAKLAIVMLTNGDDCSVSGDSLLFDPSIKSVNDPAGVGAMGSYRCNEFGHLCAGQPPPHVAPASPVTLASCVSAEEMGKTDTGIMDPSGKPDRTMGHLWPTVAEFTDYVKSFKANTDDIFVAAIAGPPTPYVVSGVLNPSTGEMVPAVGHSCASADQATTDFADPAVRIKQWTDSFGINGVFYPSCTPDLTAAMSGIAAKLASRVILRRCLTSAIVNASDGNPDCQLTERLITGAANTQTTSSLPYCDRSPGHFPCWRLEKGVVSDLCPTGLAFKVCRDAACVATADSTAEHRLNISCAVAP